jgi:cellulose synthase/poly-beta-1,6-N-acetylglucosamine synthase-like glycosyltransferase
MIRLSFIVPAHNEERLLGRTLEAIHVAARTLARPYEIVVVDDASTDATATIARAHQARVVPVNLRHIAAVRNAGAAAAHGDYLFFVDADTVVDALVVGAAARALDRGAVGGGARVAWDGGLPLWIRIWEVPALFALRVARLAAGCFFFCTRSAFRAAGGFDERVYAGEELFLSRALKRQGRFVMLREAVTTSGRKFRTYSPAEMLEMIRALGWRPWRALRERDRLALWYGERRHERP